MFDVGFWELTLVGVIALVVLGPERLPAVARNVGRWVGRARSYAQSISRELEREVSIDEIRKGANETRAALEAEIRDTLEQERARNAQATDSEADQPDSPEAESGDVPAQEPAADASVHTADAPQDAADPDADTVQATTQSAARDKAPPASSDHESQS